MEHGRKGSKIRSPSEDESRSQETTESSRSCQSSLEMDCSEPFSDQTGESNTQEMKSASSSLESYMDCSEETEQNEEEETSNENNNNDSNSSISVTISSSGVGSQDRSSNQESPSQDSNSSISVTISSSGVGSQDRSSNQESPSQAAIPLAIPLHVILTSDRLPHWLSLIVRERPGLFLVVGFLLAPTSEPWTWAKDGRHRRVRQVSDDRRPLLHRW
ncbi:uncharacterized protein [Dendrobates tinctorius]|uniref:uncharacterized protein isoform X5 n=1 Tax=Dendrobates tinctorius TaxID=92724 RepID=UPI003CC94A24